MLCLLKIVFFFLVLFGGYSEWDVEYCSVPKSPGGGYRSAIGRLIFKTNEMVQVVEAPDTVGNRVSFSAFGFLQGEVSLKGKQISTHSLHLGAVCTWYCKLRLIL